MLKAFHHIQKTTFATTIILLHLLTTANAQPKDTIPWIRPATEQSPPIWGIHGGIVVGLWPASLEAAGQNTEGGPRGLVRVGYEYKGAVYLINFIAVEPLVDSDMEFSEVSPSRVDGKWGKYFWASGSVDSGTFTPYASTRGVITHPDAQHPQTEELSLYVFMEKFLDGAYPYLKLSIRSDKPGELGIQVFNQKGSAAMQRCALTATMGNYSRLRRLYLKDTVIDSRKLFKGYNDIEFDEKDPYPIARMIKDKNGSPMAIAESDEPFSGLANWPQQAAYLSAWHWRYRPFFKLTQYWRAGAGYNSSLQVRVNGRAKYWAGRSADKSKYFNIPGGPAFENFELRENYHSGQTFYFGLTMKGAKALIGE
jgi:hypothetical protein